MTRGIWACLVLSIGACAAPPPPMAEWPNLVSHARPTVLKDERRLHDHDEKSVRDWAALREARQKEEDARLAKQPKVTAAFFELPIKDALLEISNQAKVPVVMDPTLTGTVTLNLTDVPLESALTMVLFSGNYAYSYDGRAYYVGSADPQSPGYAKLTTTRVVRTYMAPKDVTARLSKVFAPYVSYSDNSSTLTLTGPTSTLDRIEADIRLVDRAPHQVMIEVLVVETKVGGDASLGVDYGKINATLERSFRWESSLQTINQLDVLARLAATFDLLAADNVAKIRSHPKIVTSEGVPAEIRAHVESYVIFTLPGVTVFTSQVSVIHSGTTLKVTPRVGRDGEIDLAIEPEVADVVGISGEQTGSLPVISRRAVKSNVRVKNGDVVIIGGLYEQAARDLKRGLPFLKEVPVVNLLAGSQESHSTQTELLIFVSPKVVE